MQHPPVVEHDALALLQLQLEQGVLGLDHVGEVPGCLQVRAQRPAVFSAADVDLEGGLEGRRPVDGRQVAGLIGGEVVQ